MSKYRLIGRRYFTGKTVSIFFKKTKHKNHPFIIRKKLREATAIKEYSAYYK